MFHCLFFIQSKFLVTDGTINIFKIGTYDIEANMNFRLHFKDDHCQGISEYVPIVKYYGHKFIWES